MTTKKSIWIFIGIGILGIIPFLLGTYDLVRAETMQYKNVTQFTKMEVVNADDVQGHMVLIWEIRGLSISDRGVGALSGWGTCDIIMGNGPCQGYYVTKYGDGSTMTTKAQFLSKLSPDGKSAEYEGKGEITGGTGSYSGIKGSHSFKGKRITPISPGLKESRGDTIAEGTSTFTLPSK